MTAGDLALFYQGLHNRGTDGAPIIKPESLKDSAQLRSGDYKDPIFGFKVNRALGVFVAGDDGLANYRGFGKTNSPLAFGHGNRRAYKSDGADPTTEFRSAIAPADSTATTCARPPLSRNLNLAAVCAG